MRILNIARRLIYCTVQSYISPVMHTAANDNNNLHVIL